jgi:hypothetical protein
MSSRRRMGSTGPAVRLGLNAAGGDGSGTGTGRLGGQSVEVSSIASVWGMEVTRLSGVPSRADRGMKGGTNCYQGGRAIVSSCLIDLDWHARRCVFH